MRADLEIPQPHSTSCLLSFDCEGSVTGHLTVSPPCFLHYDGPCPSSTSSQNEPFPLTLPLRKSFATATRTETTVPGQPGKAVVRGEGAQMDLVCSQWWAEEAGDSLSESSVYDLLCGRGYGNTQVGTLLCRGLEVMELLGL